MNTDSYINEAVDFGPISLCATDVCFPFRDLTQGTILHFLNHRQYANFPVLPHSLLTTLALLKTTDQILYEGLCSQLVWHSFVTATDSWGAFPGWRPHLSAGDRHSDSLLLDHWQNLQVFVTIKRGPHSLVFKGNFLSQNQKIKWTKLHLLAEEGVDICWEHHGNEKSPNTCRQIPCFSFTSRLLRLSVITGSCLQQPWLLKICLSTL